MRNVVLAALGALALEGCAADQTTRRSERDVPPLPSAGGMVGAGVGSAGLPAVDGDVGASRPNSRRGMVGGAGGPGGASTAGRAGSTTGSAGAGATTEGGGSATGPAGAVR